MTTEWITPVAIHSYCGGSGPGNLIDGNIDSYWNHYYEYCSHWIVLDLGESREVTGVRLYVGSFQDARWAHVNVHVSETAGDWGDAVGTDLYFSSTNSWNERSLTPKQGRYFRFSHIDTYNSHDLLRGHEAEVEVEETVEAQPYSFIM